MSCSIRNAFAFQYHRRLIFSVSVHPTRVSGRLNKPQFLYRSAEVGISTMSTCATTGDVIVKEEPGAETSTGPKETAEKNVLHAVKEESPRWTERNHAAVQVKMEKPAGLAAEAAVAESGAKEDTPLKVGPSTI